MDASLKVRRAVVTRLRADAPTIALVPAARIFGPHVPAKTPAWPFIRYGVPIVSPLRASCLDGSTVAFMVHGFSKKPSEDEAANINAAVKECLDDAVLDLGSGVRAIVSWTGSQIMQDGAEAGAWHGMAGFSAAVLA